MRRAHLYLNALQQSKSLKCCLCFWLAWHFIPPSKRIILCTKASAWPLFSPSIMHKMMTVLLINFSDKESDKEGNVYLDCLTLLEKVVSKSTSNLATCTSTLAPQWRMIPSLLKILPKVDDHQFLCKLLSSLRYYLVYQLTKSSLTVSSARPSPGTSVGIF